MGFDPTTLLTGIAGGGGLNLAGVGSSTAAPDYSRRATNKSRNTNTNSVFGSGVVSNADFGSTQTASLATENATAGGGLNWKTLAIIGGALVAMVLIWRLIKK